MKYQFTADWFGNIELQNDLIKTINLDPTNEINILEIGSYEGRSTVWFIETYLHNINSTITCIDPWLDYSQDEKSLNSYNAVDAQWKFGSLKIKEIFENNIHLSGKKDQVIIHHDLSTNILPKLLVEKKKYDVIFIDGNHVAPFVMMDAVLCWNLLNKNGIMIFDDYLWMPNLDKKLRPQMAIDYFIEVFANYCEVKLNNYRKSIIKN
jgi:predicted O-methyltransferase YrrM